MYCSNGAPLALTIYSITDVLEDVINRYPDRFLFGTDNVAPKDPEAYFEIYEMYAPVWEKLSPEAKGKILKGNYERLFDEARRKVRAWEKANVTDSE